MTPTTFPRAMSKETSPTRETTSGGADPPPPRGRAVASGESSASALDVSTVTATHPSGQPTRSYGSRRSRPSLPAAGSPPNNRSMLLYPPWPLSTLPSWSIPQHREPIHNPQELADKADNSIRAEEAPAALHFRRARHPQAHPVATSHAAVAGQSTRDD